MCVCVCEIFFRYVAFLGFRIIVFLGGVMHARVLTRNGLIAMENVSSPPRLGACVRFAAVSELILARCARSEEYIHMYMTL